MKRILLFIVCISALTHLVAGEPAFRIDTQKLSNGYTLLGSNDLNIAIWIAIDFPQIDNLSSDQPIPYRRILPSNANKVPLLNLLVNDPSRSYSYRIVYTHALGNPATTAHDDDHRYLLPFAHGKKHRLSQGFNGRFSHQGENRYGVDFIMDEGTEIYSTREGIVVDIKEDSSIGGSSTQYGNYGNYLVIQHDDQSFGNYVHLQKNGVLVELGDQVPAGNLIALSGNTGISSGPHLHFDVRVPTYEGRMQSIPFQFIHSRESGFLVAGKYYAAIHPGKTPAQVVFGSDLRNEDYQNYRQSIPQSNRVQITSERIDNTTILFLENGFSRPLHVQVTLNAYGVVPSKSFPRTATLPPLSKRFLAILQPSGTQIQYSTKVEFLDE